MDLVKRLEEANATFPSITIALMQHVKHMNH